MPPDTDLLQLVSAVRDYIARHFGIHYSGTRLVELIRKLESFSARMGYADVADCIDSLLSGRIDEHSLHQLIESITVGETYFFREPEALEAIVSTIIPTIARRGERRLRIWVAGCATGEEAYTVAMLLHSRLADLREWNIFILASDLNNTFISKAEKGIYGSWSFRTIPSHYMSRYFKKLPDNRYELDEHIRSMVRFERINLVSGHFPSSRNGTSECDLILCRNVLMYFAPETISAIIARLARSLACDGWLIVSQTECGGYFSTCFDTVQSGNIFLYRNRKASESVSVPDTVTPVRRTSLPRIYAHQRITRLPGKLQPANSDFSGARGLQRGRDADVSRPPQSDNEEYFQRARSMADGGNLEQARLICEDGLAGNPLSLNGQYLHAVILLELGQLDDAREALRRVLYLNPDFIMATYTLGVIEQKRGNQREALNHYDRTARLLTDFDEEHVLSEAEGLTVGHLREFINTRRKS